MQNSCNPHTKKKKKEMNPLLVIITSFISTLVKANLFPRINSLAHQPSPLSMNSGKSLSKASSVILE